jgi:hypothetical protein
MQGNKENLKRKNPNPLPDILDPRKIRPTRQQPQKQ